MKPKTLTPCGENMDIITRHDLKQLAASPGRDLVSIYLPVQADQPDGAREKQRLKHLLQQVEHALGRLGRDEKAIRKLWTAAEASLAVDAERRARARAWRSSLRGRAAGVSGFRCQSKNVRS